MFRLNMLLRIWIPAFAGMMRVDSCANLVDYDFRSWTHKT